MSFLLWNTAWVETLCAIYTTIFSLRSEAASMQHVFFWGLNICMRTKLYIGESRFLQSKLFRLWFVGFASESLVTRSDYYKKLYLLKSFFLGILSWIIFFWIRRVMSSWRILVYVKKGWALLIAHLRFVAHQSFWHLKFVIIFRWLFLLDFKHIYI